MNVVIVGSTNLDLKEYAGAILSEIARLPDGTHVLLRRPLRKNPGMFEQLVAQIAGQLGLQVDWCTPEQGGGRAGVYERDIAMTQKADEVIAFFPPDDIMTGGTGHVVEKAIDADRVTNCYVVEDGHKRWVAGHEPEVQTVGVAR